MRKFLLALFLGCIMTTFAQTVEVPAKAAMSRNEQKANGIDMKKAETVVRSLMAASTGLQGVISNHYKEAIRTIAATPNDTTPMLFHPEDQAPESYVKMIEKNVFQSKAWLIGEKRLMEKGGKDFYENIMKSYDNIGLVSVIGTLPTQEQWLSRFIIPNFRAQFIYYLYWGWGDGIKESDIPIVKHTLNAIIKK